MISFCGDLSLQNDFAGKETQIVCHAHKPVYQKMEECSIEAA